MSTDQKPAAAPSAIKQVSAQEETVTVVTTTTAAAASTTTATATTTTTEQVTAPVTSVKSDVVVKEGETVEDDSHKVFVGNLSFQTKEEGLVEFFETSGKVLEAKIITIRPHYRRRSAGYGFVTFATLEDALKAAKDLNKKELDGREINVEVARPKPVVVKPTVTSESEGETAPKQPKRRARKNKNKKASQVADETAQENDGVTTRETTAAVNGKKNKNGEEEPQTSQSDNASVASDASSSRAAPRRPRRKNKNKAKNPDAAAAIAERRRIKKELTEPSQTTLFVANIPYSSTDETLQEVFKNYKVASAHVARMRNGRSKGYGFVDMESHDEQVKALDNIKDVELEGRTIYLKVALSERPRENEEKAVESADAKKQDVKKETAEPIKKEEAAPAKKEEPVPVKKEEPVKKEAAVPAKKEEPVPAKKEEPAPVKKEEPAPVKKEEPVAKKQ